MKIVADQYIPFIKEYFSKSSELELVNGRSITPKQINDADVLLVRSITTVNEELLQDSRVRFVGSVTAGADHLDTEWLDKSGIKWHVAAGFNAPPVADYVVAIIAAIQRKKLLQSRQPLRAAVIGAGNVGRIVQHRLSLLGFEVICCDPLRAENEENFSSIALNDITDVDLISLHVPLTKHEKYSTWHMIDEKFLTRQKSGCVLINASRGPVINFADLAKYGMHLQWCFDVWDKEPFIDEYFLENAFIATPHIAGYSAQSKVRGVDMIYRDMCDRELIQKECNINVHMPRQQLTFAKAELTWREVILGVFNPITMTKLMRSTLLQDKDGSLFDDLRYKFTYRHELAFTDIAGVQLAEEDQAILNELRRPIRL